MTGQNATKKNRAHGPDWSGNDINANDFKPTSNQVNSYKQGDFAFMKLTEGDKDYNTEATQYWKIKKDAENRAEQWKLMKQVGIRGAFHYQLRGQPWLAQANHFLNVVEAEGYDFHIYVLDVEKGRNEAAYPEKPYLIKPVWKPDTYFDDVYQIIKHWRLKAPGKQVMLYTNPDTYDVYLYPAIKILYGEGGLRWLEGVPLWLAWYDPNDKYPSGEGEPKTPKQRTTWDIWQYNKNGKREDYGARDLNVFNGSKEEMKAWLTQPSVGAGSPTLIVDPPTVGAKLDPHMRIPTTITEKIRQSVQKCIHQKRLKQSSTI